MTHHPRPRRVSPPPIQRDTRALELLSVAVHEMESAERELVALVLPADHQAHGLRSSLQVS